MLYVSGPVRVVVAVLVAGFWSVMLLLAVAVGRLRRGAEAAGGRHRRRPAVLDDPALGTHRFATIEGGVKLHYVEKGDRSKPLLVLVHGFLGFWYCWHHQIQALADDYWVVAIDMRGYGQSDKPAGRQHYAMDTIAQDIYHLVLSLGRQSCVLVGHDWGGIIAYHLTALRPSLVDKLVIVSAPHPHAFQQMLDQSWDQLFRSWYVYMFQLPWLPERVLLRDNLGIVDSALRAVKAPPGHSAQETVDAFKYVFGQPNAFTPPLDFYRQNVAFRCSRGERQEPARITCPVLAIWGERHAPMHPAIATATVRYADRFKLRLLPQASHWVMMEEPDQVNAFIREFIKTE